MRRRARRISAVIACLLLALLAVMIGQAEAPPIERNLTVALSGLPPGTKPIRLVLLADFHTARMGDTPDGLRKTVERVAALHPDIVVLAGDFMTSRYMGGFPPGESVEPLRGLKARFGVFAVLGNHDYSDDASEPLIRALEGMGFQVLDNEAAKAGPLTIVGVGETVFGHAKLRLALDRASRTEGVPVLVTHNPEIMAHLPEQIELALAGHTHCGQIVLPLIGPLEWHTKYGARYGCGIIRDGSRTDIITAGLGVSNLPLRLGAPPDFWVVTIVPKAPQTSSETPARQ